MKRLLAAFCFAMMASAATPAAERPEPVQVMVVGTWHFASPGKDLTSVDGIDVLTPRRQHELAAVSAALRQFKPTKVMVESIAEEPDLVDRSYQPALGDTLQSSSNERIQIGYRLAADAGLRTVYAIDEQPDADEPDYFPFDKVQAWAQAHERKDELESLIAKGGSALKAFEAKQDRSLAELLVEFNEPGSFQAGIDVYYELLRFGDSRQQVGAELNAMWYLRNAKIFHKLMSIAEPGDRIVVVYGAGHAYWLRHFASAVPGFQNVDPRPYLAKAAKTIPGASTPGTPTVR